MDLMQLQALCLSFPHVTEEIKWAHDLCFSIGGKMFLVTVPDELPITATFKVPDEEFEEFISRPGFEPAPYLARYKWVMVCDISMFHPAEIERWARQSYDLVRAKLPKKARQGLGE